jgi:outer membrane lipoprotein carrier protein
MRSLTTALLVACVTAPLGAQNIDATIDRAVAAWTKVKTVRGTFEQTVTNQITGSSATARGQYVQERPNRLSIRFSQPASDAIVADGKAVWIYLPSTAAGQVLKRPATDPASTPIDLTGQFLDSPRAKYDITAAGTRSVDGHPTHALKLVPQKGIERAIHTRRLYGWTTTTRSFANSRRRSQTV